MTHCDSFFQARQVLGDNFCQTPQFDQENLKKSCASPRLDDLHSFRRGRRQSEPPELYTPEKSRKTLPLLLEGTLPYRRTRRQSGTRRCSYSFSRSSGPTEPKPRT
ncbi:hypothetical protein XENORESO_017345 [Xenotaenia resolanae]|uniref:Uncharacterized protein n=1 Tax=Xenotaenia resolanae TaxID=208358 RepID=A0ABV0VR83_9TELE